MKKFLIFCFLCSLTLTSFALSVGDTFIKYSRFWQNQLTLNILSDGISALGVDFDLTDHRDREGKIYAFRVPFTFKFHLFDLSLEPFFYPNTNNDAWAYGGSITIKGLLRDNEIDNTSSLGYLKASFANQKMNILRTTAPLHKENFRQFAFEGGLNLNFSNLFVFDLSGNIFNYPDNVKNVVAFNGIMNQSEMGNLGTIDYVLALPDFSVGGGITWLSAENNAKSFISYRYISYEEDLTAHSVMVNTMIPVSENVIVALTYNHLFETHRTNRDLFGVGINYLF
ncbi:MAG: hypothetical protein K6E94_07425 [Elusimicrobiaceae bacterium]|nr:hypothetical protein [Elusimicrobiaceae bacterium]